MRPVDIVDRLLRDRNRNPGDFGRGSAPVNIALCKYWGKRDRGLHLPVTSSLSVSLPSLGADTKVYHTEKADRFIINNQLLTPDDPAALRLASYLDLFRGERRHCFEVQSVSSVPLAAGLASSASGFAALVLALDDLFDWKLGRRELSIIARLGSGSACRSIYSGFVQWHAGVRADGMDSVAEPLPDTWPDLCVGWIRVSDEKKVVSSREAMERTVTTSPLYQSWPARVQRDLAMLRASIVEHDFHVFGRTAESNALAMHATMLDSWPPVLFWQPRTLEVLQAVWQARAAGIACYFTIDAGPNVKLLFENSSLDELLSFFPEMEMVAPFSLQR